MRRKEKRSRTEPPGAYPSAQSTRSAVEISKSYSQSDNYGTASRIFAFITTYPV